MTSIQKEVFQSSGVRDLFSSQKLLLNTFGEGSPCDIGIPQVVVNITRASRPEIDKDIRTQLVRFGSCLSVISIVRYFRPV